jgi:membrane protein implicated in regulation of membrane protease activity
VKENKNKYMAGLALALTLFIISPADDVIMATLFGTALFGFGSIAFYIFLALSSTVSVLFWVSRRRRKERSSQPTLSALNNWRRRLVKDNGLRDVMN